MEPTVDIQSSHAVIYAADLISRPPLDWFNPTYWEQKNAIRGQAEGRGSAVFIDTPAGAAVLRRYLRGGWVARLSKQSYFFTGYQAARSLREFKLLAALCEQGLPVPEPLAGLCLRTGWFYRAALMTKTIENAQTLLDVLQADSAALETMGKVGECVQRFHQAGVYHADLNVRNILLNERGIHLIDFDKSRVIPVKRAWQQANLCRLQRSLYKTLHHGLGETTLQDLWQALLQGYAK